MHLQSRRYLYPGFIRNATDTATAEYASTKRIYAKIRESNEEQNVFSYRWVSPPFPYGGTNTFTPVRCEREKVAFCPPETICVYYAVNRTITSFGEYARLPPFCLNKMPCFFISTIFFLYFSFFKNSIMVFNSTLLG